MKKIGFYILSLFCMISCHVDIDMEEVINKQTDPQKQFAKEFQEAFGDISPDISWMTASEGIVETDLFALDATQAYTIRFYTADPCQEGSSCYLLSEFRDINGGATYSFAIDYPLGLRYLFVSAIDTNEESLTTLFPVSNDKMSAVFDDSSDSSKVLDKEYMKYRVLYEGFTEDERLDFDYNDIVTEIEYVRGHGDANITLLAAGCECEASIGYLRKGTIESGEVEVLFEEAHKALGYEGMYNHYEDKIEYLPLNTADNETGKTATVRLELEGDEGKSIIEIAPKLISYFSLIKGKKGKDRVTTPSFIPQRKGSDSPQAILIADPTAGWPRERFELAAYRGWFLKWIVEPEEYPLWYGGEIWNKANSYFNGPS